MTKHDHLDFCLVYCPEKKMLTCSSLLNEDHSPVAISDVEFDLEDIAEAACELVFAFGEANYEFNVDEV